MKLELIDFKMHKILIYSLLFLTNQLYSQSISDIRAYLDPVFSETEYELFESKFEIKIQSRRTQVNVRDTYEIAKSRVIAQVNGDERFLVTKTAKINENLLILNEDFISDDYFLNGRKKSRPKIRFIKGLRLGNTFRYSNGDYFAELTYNIRQNKEVYTLRIPRRYVKVKQSSEWYYLELLEGWILSDFCEIY